MTNNLITSNLITASQTEREPSSAREDRRIKGETNISPSETS